MDKQIEVGENSNFVTEILDFVDRGVLLKPSGQIASESEAILDLEMAKKFAWEEVYGEDEFTWADLRSEKMSEIWELIYDNEEKYSEVDSRLSNILDELSRAIQKQLDQSHKELLDDIVSDLKGCLFSRAVQGKNNEFFENVFSIYLEGGWPCGWKGDWPNGEALTYRKA
jgi:NTP pyrophosphatase (non-canonical NTP hydrolase)